MSHSNNTKICKRCLALKPSDEFYSNGAKCKVCVRECVRQRYLSEDGHSKVTKYEKRRVKDPGRKAQVACYTKAHRRAHPDRYQARTAVGNAIRDGRLVRKPCEACGSERSEAHHDDYSRPLDVRWFCRRDHRAEEGRLSYMEAKIEP